MANLVVKRSHKELEYAAVFLVESNLTAEKHLVRSKEETTHKQAVDLLSDVHFIGALANTHGVEEFNDSIDCLVHGLEWQLESLDLLSESSVVLALSSETFPLVLELTFRNIKGVHVVFGCKSEVLDSRVLFIV